MALPDYSFEKVILIVDRLGFVGEKIVEIITDKTLIVFVSQKKIQKENIVLISYKNKYPAIPDNKYSKIFVVDDFGGTRESLDKFIEKARFDEADFLFITQLEKIDKKFVEEAVTYYKKAKVLFYQDLLTETEFPSLINELVKNIRNNGRIPVPGDGTEYLYPSTNKDLKDGILEAAYGNKEGKIFYLFPQHPVTFLSFARKIQNSYPDFGVDFIKPIEKRNIDFLEGEFLVSEKNFSEKIRELGLVKEKTIQEFRPSKKAKKQKLKIENQKRFTKPFILFVFFLLLIFLMPLFSTVVLSFSAASSLSSAKNLLRDGDLEKAQDRVEVAHGMFKQANKSSSILNREAKIFGLENYSAKFSSKIEKGEDLSFALLQALDASTTIEKIFKGESKNAEKDLAKAINAIKIATSTFQKEKAEENRQLDAIEEISPMFNLISNTADVLPELLGFDEKKNYLVLFQNNMELRPGGGFIGSFGYLTLNKGKIETFKISDVYDADGQLKAHIEPPYPIRRYLPSSHLYLRDSNFAIDFAGVASSAAQLFNLETSKTANGVIAVDVSFVKELLATIGEVEVTDYKKKVNADNFFMLTETQVEKGFFPGSTQKKDFLGALFSSIQYQLIESKKVPYPKIAKAVSKGFEEKHILLAHESSSTQKLFETNGFSSSLFDDRNNNSSINDFLGISEANLGVNKANYFVKRAVTQKVSLLETGEIKTSVSISYKNSSAKETWPGGDYKNYLRFIVPKGSSLEKIEIDNNEQITRPAIVDPTVYEAKGFKNPKELEVYETEEAGKKLIGFLINVPAGKLSTIKVYLTQNNKLIKDSAFRYSLKYFKQPGTDEYPYEFLIEHPKSLKVIKTNFKDKSGNTAFGESIHKDQEINIDFANN